MLTIEIPMPTPSLNQIQRMHFHARKRMRDNYERIFRSAATKLDIAKPHQFRQVKIERIGARLLDEDNFVGGCKLLIDALRRAGLIFDDSASFVRVSYLQTKARDRRFRTIVTVI